MTRFLSVAAVLVLGPALPLAAQAPATTVQLPTFSIFTVQTTVSVPDGGGVYLGGINRAASGRVERGVPLLSGLGVPFRNRAIGSTSSASGMHVTATIIDHAEMDAAILAEAAARRGGTPVELDSPPKGVASAAASGPARNTAATGALSVAEIKRQHAAQEQSQSAEGLAYLSKAEQAAELGKAGLAKVYFRMAATRLTGDAAQQAARRAKTLEGN